jgi:FG-GAP-like repeat
VLATKEFRCGGEGRSGRAVWGDYDNDGDADLFVTYYGGAAQLLYNNGDLTFEDVTQRLGIDGPEQGLSCWSWDYDNDVRRHAANDLSHDRLRKQLGRKPL